MNTLYYDKEATKASFDIDIYLDALYLLRETPDIKHEVQAQLNQNICYRAYLRDDIDEYIDDYIDEMRSNGLMNVDKGKAMEAFDALTIEEIMNFVSFDEDDVHFNYAKSAEINDRRCFVFRVACTFDVKAFLHSIECHKNKNDELEIRKVLGLSTAHVTEETCNLLGREPEENNLCLSVYPFEYGFFVFVGGLKIEDDKIVNDGFPMDLPKDLEGCIKLALKNGCEWLQLDSDASETELLPTYER